MGVRIIPVILLFCVALVSIGAADSDSNTFNQEWRWVQFTTETGLPSDHIFDVAEGNDGTVWVATSRGLAWFDGYRWTPVDTALVPALRPASFSVDELGYLVLVVGDKLYKGNKESFQRVTSLTVSQAVPLSPDTILCMTDYSVYVIVKDSVRGTPPQHVDNARIIWRTRAGNLWYLSRNALFRWDGKEWIQQLGTTDLHLKVTQLQENESGSGIVSIGVPFQLWGTWAWKKDAKPSLMAGERGISIKSATINSSGEILACYESGIVRFCRNDQWVTINFTQPQIRDIEFVRYRRNGDLWIGTQRGLYLHRTSSSRWTYLKHESSDPRRNSVNEIIKTRNGDLWIATANGIGIYKRDGTEEWIDRIHGVPLYVVTGLIEDCEGHVWIASGGGFGGAYRWDGRTWKLFSKGTPLEGNRIHKIRMDSKGRLWFLAIWPDQTGVSSEVPLGAYVYERGRFTEHWGSETGLPYNQVYAFDEGGDGSLWFGTIGGLHRWRDGKWTSWGKYIPSSVAAWWPFSRVFTLCIDMEGRVWISDGQRGLGFVDQKDSLHYFTSADGLVSDEVYDIRKDAAGRIWIATYGGVGKCENGFWTSIRTRHGLSSSDLWPVVPIGNKIYFGSRGAGISVLDLSATNTFPPRVMIYSTGTQGRTAIIQWKVLAYWGDPSSSDIPTRYRIDKGEWSSWNLDHHTTMTEMPSGNHLIEVQAIEPFGISGPVIESSSFTIETPLARHPLFLALAGVLLTSAVAFAIVLYVRKRKFDAEIRESEAKFRVITETTSSAIFIYTHSKILFANRAAVALTGYMMDELTHMSMSDIIHPDFLKEFMSASSTQHQGSQEIVRSEIKIIRKIGDECWIDCAVGPIDFYGTPSMVGTGFDITRRKEAEEKILANQEQLRLLASELSATEERERRRMATFLHDTIGQSLAVCKIKLGLMQRAAKTAGLLEQLSEVRSFLEVSIKNTRSLTFELSPPTLHELGLVSTLEWLAEQMQLQHDMKISVVGNREKFPLTDEMRALLFHAVRELLVNVVKHAHAKSVTITAERGDEFVRILVSDDGKGQDLQKVKRQKAKNTGFGLFNISERLMRLNGRLEITSAPGKGTCVEMIAPIAVNNEVDNSENDDEQENTVGGRP